MSFVDGQLADFRGGRAGFAVEKQRVIPGSTNQTARYTLASGAMTNGSPISLTVVGTDYIGSLSGGNTWTPSDPNARYLIHVHLQTTAGNAASLVASLQTNSGTVVVNTGGTGSSGALHLVLTGDGINFATAVNIQVVALSTATLGLIGGGVNADANFIQIVKLGVY